MIRIASATLTREMLSDFLMTQWAASSFTNFFTGTVDIEAERDTNDKLIGIRECTKEVYDRHTEKYENSGLKSMPAGTSTENGDMIRNHESYSMESGDKTENMNTLQDYESYGIVYHPKDGYWYYNDQIIGIFIDLKNPSSILITVAVYIFPLLKIVKMELWRLRKFPKRKHKNFYGIIIRAILLHSQ